MTEKSEKEKLRILLAHWIGHNHSHESEMAQWKTIAKETGETDAAALIQQAIDAMQETDKALAQALDSLGGPTTNHHHHHH